MKDNGCVLVGLLSVYGVVPHTEYMLQYGCFHIGQVMVQRAVQYHPPPPIAK